MAAIKQAELLEQRCALCGRRTDETIKKMGERKIRVGELVKRELSALLHSRWRSESVAITITEVDISPDLRNARVYYSVIGGREAVAKAGKFLMSIRNQLRHLLGQKVVIKYTPELRFVYDPSVERGMHILEKLDELAADDPHGMEPEEDFREGEQY